MNISQCSWETAVQQNTDQNEGPFFNQIKTLHLGMSFEL